MELQLRAQAVVAVRQIPQMAQGVQAAAVQVAREQLAQELMAAQILVAVVAVVGTVRLAARVVRVWSLSLTQTLSQRQHLRI
jgi:hypothetical protein